MPARIRPQSSPAWGWRQERAFPDDGIDAGLRTYSRSVVFRFGTFTIPASMPLVNQNSHRRWWRWPNMGGDSVARAYMDPSDPACTHHTIASKYFYAPRALARCGAHVTLKPRTLGANGIPAPLTTGAPSRLAVFHLRRAHAGVRVVQPKIPHRFHHIEALEPLDRLGDQHST